MKLKLVMENRYLDQSFENTENKGFIAVCVASREKSGKQKMKAYPTMLMKTKENESDKWAYPTMLMKIKPVNFLGHDVIDN